MRSLSLSLGGECRACYAGATRGLARAVPEWRRWLEQASLAPSATFVSRPREGRFRTRDVDGGMVADEAALVRPHAQPLRRAVKDRGVGLTNALGLGNEYGVHGIADLQGVQGRILYGRCSVGDNAPCHGPGRPRAPEQARGLCHGCEATVASRSNNVPSRSKRNALITYPGLFNTSKTFGFTTLMGLPAA